LAASLSLLVGKYRLSKRLVEQMLADLGGVHLSVGSVSNLEREMSAALKAPVAQAQEHVRHAWVVHADETGWAQGVREGRAARAWLWVVASALVVVFRIATSRGSQVIKDLLGKDFLGWLISDRWSAYDWYDAGLRQVCWAHLTRDFQGFIDRGGRGGRIGRKLMAERDRMFKWWHRVRDGTLEREEFQRRMRQVEQKVGELLRQAQTCGEKKTAGTARRILRLEKCLWVFVEVPGVEPTNNYGERTIRQGVIYRKISFGTRSERGSRFVERILTVVTTLKLQNRNPLEFLTAALWAHRRGLPPPSLLPASESAQAASVAA
jgi:transposase